MIFSALFNDTASSGNVAFAASSIITMSKSTSRMTLLETNPVHVPAIISVLFILYNSASWHCEILSTHCFCISNIFLNLSFLNLQFVFGTHV